MTELFQRSWRVQVDELLVEAPLRVAFDVERSTRSTPNRATVRIWNLSADSRAIVEGARGSLVTLSAGYGDERAEIFRGTLLRASAARRERLAGPVSTSRDGADLVTVVEASDGGLEYRRARISRAYEAGVHVTTVLRDCAAALELGEGNLREVEALAQLEGGQTTYAEGTVLAGQAARELTRILRTFGLRWSIQHGAVQVVRRGAALQSQAVRLSAATGLVGEPEVGTGGRVRVRSLLNPELWPGRRVVLESERARGQMTVRGITLEGDSHGDAWHAACDLVPEAA